MKRLAGILGIAAALVWLQGASGSEPVPFLDQPSTLEAPFPSGERLRYHIYWDPPVLLDWIIGDVTAGEIRLKIQETEHLGREALAISAEASTRGFVRSRVLEVDDQFESVIDRRDFRSYLLKKTIREGDKNRKDIQVTFDYGGQGKVTVEKADLRKDPPTTETKVFAGVPGPLTDVLSVFYIARLRELTPGQRWRVRLADEKAPEEVVVEVLDRERVKTRLDEFNTVRLSTVGGFFNQGGNFLIWYSTDKNRFPVRFQADAKIGRVYGELVGYDSGRISRGIIRAKE